MQAIKLLAYIFLSAFVMQGCMQSGAEKGVEKEETAGYASEAGKVTPILTGTSIPDVSLQSVDGDSVQLSELLKEKPAVLIFYRGGWCPYCNKHMAQIQEAHDELVNLGYRVIAISPDQPKFLKESLQDQDLGYTLLSDSDMEASKAFGIAFKVDDETIERYKNNGLDLAERSGYDHYLLPAPAVFLVNPGGLVTFQYVNPDYKTRIKSEVLLAAAEAYYPEEN